MTLIRRADPCRIPNAMGLCQECTAIERSRQLLRGTHTDATTSRIPNRSVRRTLHERIACGGAGGGGRAGGLTSILCRRETLLI